MKVAEAFCVFAVLSVARGIQVTIPQKVYKVARGDSVTLPCTFVTNLPNPTSVIITWSVLLNDPDKPTDTVATYYYPDNTLDVSTDYESQVTMKPDIATRQANLVISGVTMTYNKTFECSVLIPKDKVGRDTDSTRVVVLVAPSKPVCTFKGDPAYGQDISITCFSAEGSPLPTYNWDSYTVTNVKRQLPPRATNINGVLSLFNISKDTSGYYVCTSANEIRSATCNYTLSVMPPSMNIGFTAGIIGGAVGGLLLLLVIVICCCCRKKKGDEDHEMEDYGKEFRDDEENKNKMEYRDDEKYADSKARSEDRRDVHVVGNERSNEYKDDNDDHRDRYDDRRDNYRNRDDQYDDRRDNYRDRDDRYDDRRDNYRDRDDQYGDRRDRYDDRRDNYRDRDDRRDDYDRRDRYDDRRDRYDDRRDRYDDRRDAYNDRSERYGDRRDQYDEVYDDRRDRYDDRDRPPSVPPGKPKNMDLDS